MDKHSDKTEIESFKKTIWGKIGMGIQIYRLSIYRLSITERLEDNGVKGKGMHAYTGLRRMHINRLKHEMCV